MCGMLLGCIAKERAKWWRTAAMSGEKAEKWGKGERKRETNKLAREMKHAQSQTNLI